MIHVRRLACPAILTEKAQKWTEAFLAKRSEDSKKRPDKRQYAHEEIITTLAAMSHGKCFYCERKLKEDEYTVDHFVEVAEAPHQAFEWTNLYLCCSPCQGKLPESQVPRAECIDPCDPTMDPAEHLTFEDEVIMPRNGSSPGRQTIRKYKLDREGLELRRLRQLQRLTDALLAIKDRQIREGRSQLRAKEREVLERFGQPEQAFSLLLRIKLQARGLVPSDTGPVH